MKSYTTAESVAQGHPDKICDQVSDAIVDKALAIDPTSRVAVETMVSKNVIAVAGEVTCPKVIDYESIARAVVADLGYTHDQFDFGPSNVFYSWIHQQSSDIALGVDTGGAGDQGVMVGYATDETEEYMPVAISFCNRIVETIDMLRNSKRLPYLRPDGKAQITLDVQAKSVRRVQSIIIAVPHDPKIEAEDVKSDLYSIAVIPTLQEFKITGASKDMLIVNGTGKWEIGGPASDTGVTGRKIICDTYGPIVPHGGGAFSGKDPTKVDRSAAYGCRYVAKNIVASGRAKRCMVRVAYAIGSIAPTEIHIDCFSTEISRMSEIQSYAQTLLSFKPKEIRERLSLSQPIYRKSAAYGHFGRSCFPWERIAV